MGRDKRLIGVRILVVEDMRDVREAYAALLVIEGARVSAVSTGREALDLVARGTFDIVVTDLGLPDIPGETVIRQISTIRPSPFIVVITGYTDLFHRRARDAGADAVFAKPVDWAALVRCLDTARRRSEAA